MARLAEVLAEVLAIVARCRLLAEAEADSLAAVGRIAGLYNREAEAEAVVVLPKAWVAG